MRVTEEEWRRLRGDLESYAKIAPPGLAEASQKLSDILSGYPSVEEVAEGFKQFNEFLQKVVHEYNTNKD